MWSEKEKRSYDQPFITSGLFLNNGLMADRRGWPLFISKPNISQPFSYTTSNDLKVMWFCVGERGLGRGLGTGCANFCGARVGALLEARWA